ncbi:hypothetical protein HMPREF0083_03339 [Aneurinibacillus aneurinilyticus ATCC 12856]|uniref:Uncharacterized protein n=1 Tax=Aneurinibacillus aneurinilyticus ATCC 12856 TaxID=649747 RepID=U1YCT0_ANEAE|nr:hypothetical protein HMPREF0083_03339 [Aneurinibacillus aneurinilyticus ATCC 12856]
MYVVGYFTFFLRNIHKSDEIFYNDFKLKKCPLSFFMPSRASLKRMRTSSKERPTDKF